MYNKTQRKANYHKINNLLGMNHSTAVVRLTKDLLWATVEKEGTKCYRCGKEMTREDFSIEHKNAWGLSEKPMEAFFDLDNISYSHGSCNSAHRERQTPECGTRNKYKGGCRCDPCKKAHRDYNRKYDKRNNEKKRQKRLEAKNKS